MKEEDRSHALKGLVERLNRPNKDSMFVQISGVMSSLEEGWNNILCDHRIEDIKDLHKILQVIVTYRSAGYNKAC